MMDDTGDKVGGIPRKSMASSGFSSNIERYSQELVDNEDEFHVRPPSGTNHQVDVPIFQPVLILTIIAVKKQ